LVDQLSSSPKGSGPSITRGDRRPAKHRRVDAGANNLTINSISLVIAALANAALGLVFWAVVAKLFAPASVGAASAVITSCVAASAFSNLSIGAMFERFLSATGGRIQTYLIRGLGLAALCAIIVGTVLALGLSMTGKVFEHRWEIIAVPLWVLVLGLFSLSDQLANALGVGRWAAMKNVVHAVAKLMLVAGVGALGWGSSSIVLSWIVPAVVTVAVLVGALYRRAGRRAQLAPDTRLPPRAEMTRYFVTSYALVALSALTPTLVPLAIVTRLDTEANAYFALTWAMVGAVFILMTMLVGPVVAEVANNAAQAHELISRFMALTAAIAVAGACALIAVGPILLGYLGQQYRHYGEVLLVLGAATLPFMTVNIFYSALARLHRKLGLAVGAKLLASVMTVGGSFVLVGRFGISGAGYAYLVGEGVSALIVIVPLLRLLRRPTAVAA
jgi:O-antigen/teichoic acid export membrane protein